MKRTVFGVGLAVAVGLVSMVVGAVGAFAGPEKKTAAELDARRLMGQAHYENDKYAEAAVEFRRCLELAPTSAVDYFNLGLVLMRVQEYEESLAALAKAQELDPELLAPHYVRGIIYKRQGQFDQAVERLEHVTGRDPQCRGAYYNLGVCYKFLKQYEDAIDCFKKEARLSPDDPSTHYQLITLYRRTDQADKAQRHKEIFDRVKDTVAEAEKTAEALERSKYTYIIDAPRLTADLKSKPEQKVRFVEVTQEWGLLEPSKPAVPETPDTGEPEAAKPPSTELRCEFLDHAMTVLADYDGDQDLDIYIANASYDAKLSVNRLFRNAGQGKFQEVGAAVGVDHSGSGFDAVFGDYDNDGDEDLYLVNCGPNVLYRNKGDGRFEDVSEAAQVDEPQFGERALFFDYDHDNDLDIFVGNSFDWSSRKGPWSGTQGGQSNALLRNNGNGTFSDQTDEAGLLADFAPTRDAECADFDGDHDIDLLVANFQPTSRLFLNARLGRFVSGGSFTPPVPRGVLTTASGDFNGDGHMDLIFATGGARFDLYTNDGRANFKGAPIKLGEQRVIQDIVVFDYNNDGWSDLLVLDRSSLRLLAGVGKNEFRETTKEVGLDAAFQKTPDTLLQAVAAGDLDGDGDEDIVTHILGKGPRVLRNDGGNRGHWLNVRLVGKKANRSGYGATVEIASGGHYQKQTYTKGWAHFGLGGLKQVDVVRVTWPNGVAQNVIRPEINRTLTIEEYVRVSASCGFLYAYNGRRFELVNEILGIGPLGVPLAPGVYHQPDCTELTGIDRRQLVAQDGSYELRLTEELREITYADQITLRVVDHPADLEIIPNEYFTAPPFPEDKFLAVGDHRPPRSAIDDRGRDVLDLVLRHDGRFPTFATSPYDGLAEPHQLTLDLGDLSQAERIMLYLDGWIYWPESSVVMALAQNPSLDITPLVLEVRDEQGRWQTAIESVGLPTSKGVVVPVDLTDSFLCDDYHVRLSTNLCVYLDRIFVSTRDQAARCRQTELPVARADLRYRGFSRMSRDEFGYERFDYAEVSPTGPWDPPAGMFTRYGDVTPLLARPDDMYVIFGPGDELGLRFDAAALPELPAGWTRDFIFYANGWVKDGDLNTTFSGTVEPLPFHGMSGYPYLEAEQYPDTPEHRRYLGEYNTRPARSTVGSLVRPAAAGRSAGSK